MAGYWSWSWNEFCGRDENISAWINSDFGYCFEQITIVFPTNCILAIISAYYAAQRNNRPSTFLSSRWCWSLKTRVALSFLLALLPVIRIVILASYRDKSISISDAITSGVVALAWLMETLFQWRLKNMFWQSTRGPLILNLCVALVTVSSIIQVRSVALQRINHSVLHDMSYEIITYIILGLHALFFCTLIPSPPSLTTQVNNNGHIQAESDGLLTGGRQVRGYGSVQQPSETLGTAETSNVLSKLAFHWVTPMMVKGARRAINSANDLFTLPDRLNTEMNCLKFSVNLHRPKKTRGWDISRESSSPETTYTETPHVEVISPNLHTKLIGKKVTQPPNSNRPRSMLSALNQTFGCEYYGLGILKLLADGLGFMGPVLLNLLVSYIENKNAPEYNGYIYASGLFASTLLGMFFTSQFNYHINVVGFKIRAAIISTVYRKALSVNSVSIAKFNTGEIVNFMSTDTDRIVNFCPSFHAFWSLPFQIGVSLYLLHQQVGLAFLAGLAFAIILIPINKWLANKIGELSTKMMAQKDARVKVMSEILHGIRILKLYSWEEHFARKITALRELELKSLKGRKYLDALCVYFWATTPVIISILTFTTYSLMGNKLTAAKVFTSLSLFVMLISPLNAFPWVLNGLMEAWVSLKRVQAFLALKDSDLTKYYSEIENSQDSGNVLEVENSTFAWFDHSEADEEPSVTTSSQRNTMKLKNINLGVKKYNKASIAMAKIIVEEYKLLQSKLARPLTQRPVIAYKKNKSLKDILGMLVGVVGKVGSGKTSLLSAILGEMVKETGRVNLLNAPDGFAVATQEAWLQHATLRDNILFGKAYNIRRYDQVIEACALSDDLQILPSGDRTEIGENGVTLSGGQKARVALARAVYQDKDVYLLDDPLAAVDAHVAQHLFDKCIMGLLELKTRIVCTHHVNFLQEADCVVLMDDGKIISIGTPSEVLESEHLKDIVYKIEEPVTDDSSEAANEITSEDSLVKEEERDTGVVKLTVYKSYWRAVGSCLASSIFLALFLMQASRNVNDWWLSYWVSHTGVNQSDSANSTQSAHSQQQLLLLLQTSYRPLHSETNVSQKEDEIKFYLTVYGALAGANSIFTLFRAFLFAYGGIRAAQVLHTYVLASILKAPMGFFDSTPIGRIVNRFSSDIYSIDDALPFIMNILLAQIFSIVGCIIITCYGLPWFSLLLIPLTVVYYFVQQYYRHTSREIKRISSVTLSPIYAHFSETIGGLAIIKAFRQTERFMKENTQRLDLNQRAQFAACAASSWLGFRLQLLGVAMVTGVAFTAVLEHHFQMVNPGLVGLAITYALSITNLLSAVVTSFTETEKQMISVERVQQYIDDVPSEKLEGVLIPPPYWPIQGAISFMRVHLQYRAGLPDALDGISFETRPAEKIGVVGRTGSGKSSLFLALFRMVEIRAGEIHIDGINIHHLDLVDLRSRLAIIPQDPFLFSGCVQDNLDPRGDHSDRELWNVLEKCHLKDVVERLGGLRADVAERGRHFSQGQKQLLCLARALLKRAKVLCIDEATASVDLDTDRYIQDTIRDEFQGYTVITIAHRINTIVNCDRVMVMGGGKVLEFAAPKKLLDNPKSEFYKLSHGTL